MRWQRLFEDLEAQAEQAEQSALDSEVADRTRREMARIRLADRFRAGLGQTATINVLGLGPLQAVVQAVGPDWLLVTERPGSETLVPRGSLTSVSGLGPQATVPGSEGRVAARLGIAFMLRGIARDRHTVSVLLVDGSASVGTVQRVGADFFELAEHDETEARRPGTAPAAARCVPFSGLALLRRPV
jgi:hypothetical protein